MAEVWPVREIEDPVVNTVTVDLPTESGVDWDDPPVDALTSRHLQDGTS